MSKLAKRQHYLPQFYLRSFADRDGLLCVFDRETKTFRRQRPLNTALEKDFYTITDAQGERSDGLEQMFSKLESAARGVIARVEAGQTGWKDEQEQVYFAVFVAYLYCRTPTFHKEQTALAEQLYRSGMKANHPTADVTAQLFEQFAKATGDEVDRPLAEEFFAMVQNDRYAVEVPRQNILKVMVAAALHLAGILLSMNWTFATAPPDLAFITSDAPFVITPPPHWNKDWRSYGVLTPGTASTIPLSARTFLMVQGAGNMVGYGRMPKDVARHANENVARNSDRFIIARDQPYLESLVKRTRVDQHRWNSRFEFETGEVDRDLIWHAKHTQPPKD
jgi:hypothetical protein